MRFGSLKKTNKTNNTTTSDGSNIFGDGSQRGILCRAHEGLLPAELPASRQPFQRLVRASTRLLLRHNVFVFHHVNTHWVEIMSNRRVEYRARSFVRTSHSFACSALLASLARSGALIRSFARSLTRSRAHGKAVFVYEMNSSILYNSGPQCRVASPPQPLALVPCRLRQR